MQAERAHVARLGEVQRVDVFVHQLHAVGRERAVGALVVGAPRVHLLHDRDPGAGHHLWREILDLRCVCVREVCVQQRHGVWRVFMPLLLW